MLGFNPVALKNNFLDLINGTFVTSSNLFSTNLLTVESPDINVLSSTSSPPSLKDLVATVAPIPPLFAVLITF